MNRERLPEVLRTSENLEFDFSGRYTVRMRSCPICDEWERETALVPFCTHVLVEHELADLGLDGDRDE